MCLAVPGKVLAIEGEDPAFRMAYVDFCGVRKTVNLAFTPEAAIGDFVLFHVGFALTKIDQEEAARTYRYLVEILAFDIAGDADIWKLAFVMDRELRQIRGFLLKAVAAGPPPFAFWPWQTAQYSLNISLPDVEEVGFGGTVLIVWPNPGEPAKTTSAKVVSVIRVDMSIGNPLCPVRSTPAAKDEYGYGRTFTPKREDVLRGVAQRCALRRCTDFEELPQHVIGLRVRSPLPPFGPYVPAVLTGNLLFLRGWGGVGQARATVNQSCSPPGRL